MRNHDTRPTPRDRSRRDEAKARAVARRKSRTTKLQGRALALAFGF